MFQKTDKNPYNLDDINENKLIYIPESRQKINNDLSKYQYFINFIQPDYNVKTRFDIQSKDDKRFQTRVDLLLEREQEMRQGSFNPMMYKQHIENNNPQNLITKIYTPSEDRRNKQPGYTTKYPTTPANPLNRPINYMNINNHTNIYKDNNMGVDKQLYMTNLSNIYNTNDTAPGKTMAINYNNKLFTNNEKEVIHNYNLKQENIDPLYLLNKESYTIGSLNTKYKSLYHIYSKASPLYPKINKAIKQLDFIIKNTF